MGEFRQGKERGKIALFGVLLLLGAIAAALLVVTSPEIKFIQVVLIIGALVALYFCYKQLMDFLSDPVLIIDATGIRATGYMPASRNFNLTWAEAGTAYLRAAGGSGGTLTFMAKNDSTRVLAVLHGYSRYLNLNELRDLIKEHMGVAPALPELD